MTNSPYRHVGDNKLPHGRRAAPREPAAATAGAAFQKSDSWRVLRIMGEFVWGFDNLADVSDGVTIFGSARTPASDPHYAQAVQTAMLLAQAGIPVITGGGPGIMEAAKRGIGKGAACRSAATSSCHRAGLQRLSEPEPQLQVLLRRKTMFVKYATAFIVFPGGYGTSTSCSRR